MFGYPGGAIPIYDEIYSFLKLNITSSVMNKVQLMRQMAALAYLVAVYVLPRLVLAQRIL